MLSCVKVLSALLSVRCHRVGNEVQHFKIGKPTPGQYNVWEQSFVSVTALVNQYRNESISRTHNVTLRCAPRHFTSIRIRVLCTLFYQCSCDDSR